MVAYDSQRQPVQLGERVGHGGEATVYRLSDRPMLLAKIYEPAPRPEYLRKLSWMVQHPPQRLPGASPHPALAWPTGLLFGSDGKLAGYLMPYIQLAVPALEVFNPRRRTAILPQFDRRYLHRTARNLAAALGSLHASSYIAGDLNESNVLVTPSALVTLIDTDSFQVSERTKSSSDRAGKIHLCPVGKFEYTAPELQGQSLGQVVRGPEHDAFALAVMIFQLLMDGSHPFRAQWLGGGDPPPVEARIAQGAFPYAASPAHPVRPPKGSPGLNVLHPSVAELVRRAFIDGHTDPHRRPDPVLWERALAEAESALIACPKGHFFSNHLSTCPYCPRQPVRERSWRPAMQAFQPAPAAAPASSPGGSRPGVGSPFRRPSGATRPTGRIRPTGGSRPAAAGPSPASASPTTPGSAAAGRRIPPGFRPAANPWQSVRPFVRQATGNMQGSLGQRLWPGGFGSWARLQVANSLTEGGGWGILAGLLLGALVSVIVAALGYAIPSALLWGAGAMAGGVVRGWRPGQRLGRWVEANVGWSRFWQGAGMLIGSILGFLGGLFFWYMVFPPFIGLFSGGKLGQAVGRRIWLLGARYGWERVWTVAGAANAALLGWFVATMAGLLGAGVLTDGAAAALTTWLVDLSVSEPLIWAATGALGGATGGLIGGVLTDLPARFLRLVD